MEEESMEKLLPIARGGAVAGPEKELAMAKVLVTLLVQRLGGRITLLPKELKELKGSTRLRTQKLDTGGYEIEVVK